MIRQEDEHNRNDNLPLRDTDLVLSDGKWSETISWSFIASCELPSVDFCTAVCCVVTFRGKLILVKNKRGWELPAGKKELNEMPNEAAIREVFEESRAVITHPQIFGYKRLTAREPVPKIDNPTLFYPFPHSYVAFFCADADSFMPGSPEKDIKETRLVNYEEALVLLKEGAQYTGVLEFLRANKLISVE